MGRLRPIHPESSEPEKRQPRDDLTTATTLSKAILRKTAKKMDETSAVGPDGMSVNQLRLILRDGTHDPTVHAGENIVLSFLQITADFLLFPQVAELFASTRLISFQKPPRPSKPPGIRPIAIGIVIRRVTATMVLKITTAEAADFLLPQKVSLALSAGTEVLIHGFRDVLSEHGL